MSVARTGEDGTRYIQFWDISQVQAAVIRGCWGEPSEEIIESPEHHARAQADEDGLTRRPA